MDRTRDLQKKQNHKTPPQTSGCGQGLRKSKPSAGTSAKGSESIVRRLRADDSRLLRAVERNEKVPGRHDRFGRAGHWCFGFRSHKILLKKVSFQRAKPLEVPPTDLRFLRLLRYL